MRGFNTVEDNTSNSWSKIREYAGASRKQAKVEEAHAQPRYCYHVYQDTVCYSEPVATLESKLIAYQDSSAHTGYVIPAPAEIVKPATVQGKISLDSPAKPVIKPLQKVNVATPPAIAETPKEAAVAPKTETKAKDMPTQEESAVKKKADKQLKEIIFDPSELQPRDLVPQKTQ